MVKIVINTQPYEDLYKELLASIPAGNQWHKGPIILPLPSAEDTPFIIESDTGDVVSIYNNNVLQTQIVMLGPSQQINLRLKEGKNFITALTSGSQFLVLVVAANYATIMRGYSEEFFYKEEIRFRDVENQLNSSLSLRSVEHQIDFQQDLPPTRAFRVLAGKLAVRSLINETGSTRGVDDIVTAASNTTPVVVETTVDTEFFEPSVRTLYSTAHDAGGYAFHVWLPNICVGTWAAFIKLMDNLDDSIANLTSVSDERVTLDFLGVHEEHNFDFEESGCSLIDLLARDCLPITVSVATHVNSEVAFCAWKYPFDVVVESALGRSRFDSISGFRLIFIPSDFSLDATGSETGSVGASYIDIAVTRVIDATVVDRASLSMLPSFVIPGTSRVVVVSGLPTGSVTITGMRPRLLLDGSIPLDSCEESDPLCDGWFGTPIVDRLDGDHCLDTTASDVVLFADLDCCFTRPQATLLSSSLVEVTASTALSSFAGLVIS